MQEGKEMLECLEKCLGGFVWLADVGLHTC